MKCAAAGIPLKIFTMRYLGGMVLLHPFDLGTLSESQLDLVHDWLRYQWHQQYQGALACLNQFDQQKLGCYCFL